MPHHRRRFALLAVVAALLALAAASAACGDGDGSASRATGTPAADTTPGADSDTPSPGDAGGAGGLSGVTVAVDSASAAVGAEATVELRVLGLTEPGLGAWTVEVAYDPAAVSVVSCTPPTDQLAFCNTDFPSTVRLAGDVTLATLTFRCAAAGAAALDITVEVLADATIGAPRDITPAIEVGAVECG